MSDKPWNQNCPADKIFDAFLNLSRDGVYIVGEDGGFLEVNPAYYTLLGYSREELLILSIPDVETNKSPETIFRAGITENLGEGVSFLSRAGLVTFMNPATEELMGCGPQEVR